MNYSLTFGQYLRKTTVPMGTKVISSYLIEEKRESESTGNTRLVLVFLIGFGDNKKIIE